MSGESLNEQRLARIRQALVAALAPQELALEDFSHEHAGHAGARDGRGHFAVRIVSRNFEGVRTLARHRMVYDAVGDMMQSDIHALTIDARTPDEA